MCAPVFRHTNLLELLQRAQTRIDAVVSSNELSDEMEAGARDTAVTDLYSSIVKIQAPMVRCSRPAFRKLCRLWGTDISYTHMIMADSFIHSSLARDADFALYDGETRLVAQIACHDGPQASQVASLLQPYCDAIDLNCGCPQPWAIEEGVGCALLTKPELVADMIRCIHNGLSSGHPSIPCVVKLRVDEDIRKTVDFAQQCVAAGAGWLTIHGRTPQCGSRAPVLWDAIKTVRNAVGSAFGTPIVANGGVTDPSSAVHAALRCGPACGVMSANGLLDNPASFYLPSLSEQSFSYLPSPFVPAIGSSCVYDDADSLKVLRQASGSGEEAALFHHPTYSFSVPPLEVISDFLRLAVDYSLAVTTTIHHFLRMARMYLSPMERTYLAGLKSNVALLMAVEECGLYTHEGKYMWN